MKVAVVGLGYVGLPLAVALARKHEVVGFDISTERVAALRRGTDWTNEVAPEALRAVGLAITSDVSELGGCEVFIVTVPTPIDEANRPDFGALLKACALVGPALSKGAIVVFESTVYPGVTEEVCAPALEQASGLEAGENFKLGYQPEVILSGRRVNDGMGAYLAQRVVKLIAGNGQPMDKARVGILGFTFKENVPDIRNSKVIDTYRELREFGIEPIVHDPLADADAVREEYGVELAPIEDLKDLRALIYAVGHDEYRPLHGRISDLVAEGGIVADVRSLLDPASLRPDIRYWSL